MTTEVATTPSNEVQAVGTPAELIEKYISLRDQKEAAKKKFDEFMKTHYGDPMDAIEVQILDVLNQQGIDSLAAKSGSAYKKVNTSVTVGDASSFRRHVIGESAWDLIDWRANKTAVNDLVENGEELPPGLNRSTFISVGIRRK
jgi:hypothetical protein